MRTAVVGVNYASAPMAIRERLSVSGHELDSALSILRSRAREALVLSTCNRTEVYGVFDDSAAGVELLEAFLAEWGRLPLDDVRAVAYAREHAAAVRHALRVASGLESMVLGEDQIQAQVKQALAAARHAETLGPTLERLGSAALACGKRVRTFTGIGRHSVSLESLAVRRARERLGSLERWNVVVLGAGESASLVARQLKSVGATALTVVSRSSERASALALAVNAEARSLADLADVMATADVVFCCASAPHPVLTPDFLTHRAALRPGAPLLCVDLGMPRDVDPFVTMIPGVSILTLDELAGVAETHREARRADVPAAEAIVDTEVGRFLEWLNARAAAERIAAVDAHATAVAENELTRALVQLPALGPREREILAEMAYRIARKLSHQPKQALKQDTGPKRMALG
ncbi:MAG: glutamyl-tRNA reductase [Gemmatimonadaceae bacterium]